MKIFYAVQATGNGHISRAAQMLPYLKNLGTVDVFLSGSNVTLNSTFPVKFRSKGLSIFYSKSGGLDFKKMFRRNSLVRAYREALHLPIEKYDLILNDFDFITAQSCKIKKIPSVALGHQASFISNNTPRPNERSGFGELILKHFAPATEYIGFHFKCYDPFILPPVIKTEFQNANVQDKGHVTVYLPAYTQDYLAPHFKALPNIEFHWFLQGITTPHKSGNITYFPVNEVLFNESFIHCHGIITGGGFETPAEALYMKKQILCIPIRGQYEQQCNAAALKQLGVTTLQDVNPLTFSSYIVNWLRSPRPQYEQRPNNLSDTMNYLIQVHGRL